jgi:hypothetical protein
MPKPRILRLNGGHLYHAVDVNQDGKIHSRQSKAVCGAKPGKTNGVREALWYYEGGVVTCQKCLKALKKRSVDASPSPPAGATPLEYSDIATATLDQLTDELAAAGWESGYSNEQDAREAVMQLFLAHNKAPLKRIDVTWDGDNEVLVAVCESDHTLSSSVVHWPEPLAVSFGIEVARAITRINGAKIAKVDEDGEDVTVFVFA